MGQREVVEFFIQFPGKRFTISQIAAATGCSESSVKMALVRLARYKHIYHIRKASINPTDKGFVYDPNDGEESPGLKVSLEKLMVDAATKAIIETNEYLMMPKPSDVPKTRRKKVIRG